MPVRDGERFLVEAVESVLAQTEPDLELVVVDDGSTDSTPRLLAGLTDPRVRVLTQPPLGLTAALNAGCAAAAAPVIARMDADDVALPGPARAASSRSSTRTRRWRCSAAGSCSSTRQAASSTASGRRPSRRSSSGTTSCTARSRCARTRSARSAATGSTSPRTSTSGCASRSATASPRSRSRSSATGSIPASSRSRSSSGRRSARSACGRRRASGGPAGPDPLDGVERLDDGVAERLGVSQEEIDGAVVADAVQWAATLARVGRDAEAEALLDTAAAVPGAPPRRTLARRAQLLLLKRAVRHGRVGESARRLAGWARA